MNTDKNSIKNCEISIIMPLYNASKYLSESIDCILNQTFDRFELICVNDASDDDTATILREYELSDDRIRVFTNQARMGAALSRNSGIDKSRGEYLIFLDGDDYFEDDLLESCHSCATDTDADIVFFNYGHFSGDKIYEKGYAGKDGKFYSKYATHPFAFRSYADPELISDLCATCNKFYRRDFVVDNSIRFQDQPRQNDVMFSFLALLVCDRVISLCDDRMMVHARDHDEPSRITNTKNPIYTFYAVEGTLEEIKNRNRMKSIMPKFYSIMLDIIIGAVKKAVDDSQGNEYYDYLKNFGYARISELCERHDLQMNAYTRLREYCFELPYESMWWKYDEAGWLDFILQLYKKNTSLYFEKALNGFNGLIVWGCGDVGAVFVDYLDKNLIGSYSITDGNPKRWGEQFHGHVILETKSVERARNMLVITTSRKINIDELKDTYDGLEIRSLYDVISESYKCSRTV